MKLQCATFRPETLDAIHRITHPDRLTIFGALDRRYLFRWIKQLFKQSGLDGTFKYVRRGSGSMVERDNPGWGHKHLGNTPEVFRKHYEDKRITNDPRMRPMPPRIIDPSS